MSNTLLNEVVFNLHAQHHISMDVREHIKFVCENVEDVDELLRYAKIQMLTILQSIGLDDAQYLVGWAETVNIINDVKYKKELGVL